LVVNLITKTENLYLLLEIQMDTSTHTLQTLFCQLGLANGEEQMVAFIQKHRPLSLNIALHKACFWTKAQAAFLAESIAEDSDWCELVDELSNLLREN
jgi:Protein of unknown function (DUF2789)